MPPDAYNVILTLHATVMVFLVLIPLQIGAFGNYLVPLKIGARDMAFPVLNGLSVLDLPGRVGDPAWPASHCPANGAAVGWTSYPPLSARSPFNGAGSSTAFRGVLSVLQPAVVDVADGRRRGQPRHAVPAAGLRSPCTRSAGRCRRSSPH